VTLADGSGTFAIEQHEVTRKQYQQFLEAPAADVALAVGTPPPGCSTVSNFPDATCLADPSVCASNCDRHPQVCVHWCGAYAYCKWLGRRLCGKIGGGSTDATQSRSPQISQWTAACVGTQGSADVFPYGAIPVPRRCNDLSSGISTVEVAQKRDCHGGSVPFDSIYDLSGNVAEWGDSCVVVDPANQTVRCQTRGGSFNDDPDSSETGPSLRCAGSILDWTDMFSCLPYVGFRCCMD
jgi:formylglycine-generating enzyme required for sulfatase activity